MPGLNSPHCSSYMKETSADACFKAWGSVLIGTMGQYGSVHCARKKEEVRLSSLPGSKGDIPAKVTPGMVRSLHTHPEARRTNAGLVAMNFLTLQIFQIPV